MELDNFKKVWKEQETASFNREEILAMLKEKSSSVAKWIFYISIAEFFFWIGMSFILPENQSEIGENATFFMKIVTYVNYVIVIGFILFFFFNFKKIKAEQNIKHLLKNILNLRKTVHYYVAYNLSLFIGATLIVSILMFNDDTARINIPENMQGNILFWAIVILSFVVVTAVFSIVLYLFYRLLYGFLLKRLQRNYEEIQQL